MAHGKRYTGDCLCGALRYEAQGDVAGKDDSFAVYAGTLDDPSAFQPKIAIFARSRPAWAVIPPDLAIFEGDAA